ncbi:MAG TPA: hypothetical protein VID27_19635, partial [Blastocatellia bacterium]
WSLIGVGVLVGAIVIIAVSVLFSPRTPDLPAIARSTPPAPQASQPSTPEPSVKPDIVVEEVPIAEVKKREKPADASNSNTSGPDPKAAARESEQTEPASNDSRVEPPKPIPSETDRGAVPPVVKPKGETDTSVSKPAPSPGDPKADKKKEPEKGKEEKKDEKKKGGLFRFFKKIFGKG